MKREYTIEEVKEFEADEYKKCHCGKIPIRIIDVDPYKQGYFYYQCLYCNSYSDCFFEGEKTEK